MCWTTRKELDLWQQVLKGVSLQTTEATFDSWFTGTSLLAPQGDSAVIGVLNEQAEEWLDRGGSQANQELAGPIP